MTSAFQDYPDYFKFAFVRNPWDRLVSFYCSNIIYLNQTDPKKQNPNKPFKLLGCDKDTDFETFVKLVFNVNDAEANVHYRSQHALIAKDKRIDLLDFIGHFEDLNADWNRLMQLLPASVSSQLSDLILWANKSEHSHYSAYYTDKLRDLVAERYKDDIELLKYRFDLVPQAQERFTGG
jgi:hypothetical protein